MENTMEKNTVNTNETRNDEKVSMEYQGLIYVITKEEFDNLKNGWTTFKEMFG